MGVTLTQLTTQEQQARLAKIKAGLLYSSFFLVNVAATGGGGGFVSFPSITAGGNRYLTLSYIIPAWSALIGIRSEISFATGGGGFWQVSLSSTPQITDNSNVLLPDDEGNILYMSPLVLSPLNTANKARATKSHQEFFMPGNYVLPKATSLYVHAIMAQNNGGTSNFLTGTVTLYLYQVGGNF